MHIQHVSIGPSEQALQAGRYTLTPELLAATGARYSRTGEGLDAIISKIDFDNPDKSVDSIFVMTDYGHQSIGDMVPVAIFIDQISIFAAFTLWYLCNTASGQESSTRYINYKNANCYHVDGALENQDVLFKNYQLSYEYWINLAKDDISAIQLPKNASEKERARMTRNFAFDRARVWLPMSALTNMMMIQSARNWVDLISVLLSHPFIEIQEIGNELKKELALVAPRLLKHATPKQSNAQWMADWIDSFHHIVTGDTPYFHVNTKSQQIDQLVKQLLQRENRYGACGDVARRSQIEFGIPNIAMAEIRDLNRHRTGHKYVHLYPTGFYNTLDVCPHTQSTIHMLADQGEDLIKKSRNLTCEQAMYSLPIGAQFTFLHNTTLDKFIYEAELRTGLGVHYKYCEHMKAVLQCFYQVMPDLKGRIFEGQGEPE